VREEEEEEEVTDPAPSQKPLGHDEKELAA
jgi:hypothetical protein